MSPHLIADAENQWRSSLLHDDRKNAEGFTSILPGTSHRPIPITIPRYPARSPISRWRHQHAFLDVPGATANAPVKIHDAGRQHTQLQNNPAACGAGPRIGNVLVSTGSANGPK